MHPHKPLIPALTGYRAIAAWMIFVYHYFPYQSANLPQCSKHMAVEFRMGIDLFFVLSGFLITYRYYGQKPLHFRNYIVKRFARIYPVHLMLSIITYLLIFKGKPEITLNNWAEFLANLTLTKALFKDYIFTGIAQGWTLTMEELFYFSAPLFFILIKRKWWTLILIPFSIFFLYYGIKLFSIQNNLWGGFMQINIAKYIFDFFIGITLALLFFKNKSLNIKYLKFTYLGIFMILVYIVIRSLIREQIDTANDFVRSFELTLLSAFGIAPLIWGLIHEKTWISKLLSTKPMILLGKSSYVFYLIHWSFISVLITVHLSENKILLFILLNITSVIIYSFYEKPMNIFFKNLWLKKKITTD